MRKILQPIPAATSHGTQQSSKAEEMVQWIAGKLLLFWCLWTMVFTMSKSQGPSLFALFSLLTEPAFSFLPSAYLPTTLSCGRLQLQLSHPSSLYHLGREDWREGSSGYVADSADATDDDVLVQWATTFDFSAQVQALDGVHAPIETSLPYIALCVKTFRQTLYPQNAALKIHFETPTRTGRVW
jgi:hypothetical protein